MIIFWTSCIVRKSDNAIDWKGCNEFTDYQVNVLQPLVDNAKFKTNFATQNNFQELERKIAQEINPSLVTLNSSFANLTNASELNGLINNYYRKISNGLIYSEIAELLAKQLITGYQKYEIKSTVNSSKHPNWEIISEGLTFKKGS